MNKQKAMLYAAKLVDKHAIEFMFIDASENEDGAFAVDCVETTYKSGRYNYFCMEIPDSAYALWKALAEKGYVTLFDALSEKWFVDDLSGEAVTGGYPTPKEAMLAACEVLSEATDPHE